MKPDLDVAATMECEPELLPYLPEILRDFDSLGSDPRRAVEMLETAGAGDGLRRALDLGCGKGATSIALAARFGVRVDGVDAIAAFVASATKAAAAAGVADRCRFTTGDLCRAVTRPDGYDLVVFSSIGPILGGITRTVAHLMTPLRPRGWLLIEDSVLLPGAPARPGFEGHAGFEETRRRTEAAGAELVAVRESGGEALVQHHDRDNRRLARRARALVGRRPELAAPVARYLERQRRECAFLERWTREITWLLRKPAG